METIDIIEDKKDLERKLHTVYLSDRAIDDIISNDNFVDAAIGHSVVGYAYTDYGGDEYDRIVCDFVKKNEHKFPSYYETTSYNGANCVIFGEKADRIMDANGDLYKMSDAIGFDLDDAVEEFENWLVDDELDATLEEIKDNFGIEITNANIKWVRYWLKDHGNPTATTFDYSTDDLFDAFEREQLGNRDPEPDEFYESRDSSGEIKYRWICDGDSGGFIDESDKLFDTQKECYTDMMQHAIDKMKWNVEWSDVIDDSETYEEDGLVKSDGEMDVSGNNKGSTWGICYKLECHPHMIQHHSYILAKKTHPSLVGGRNSPPFYT